MKLSEILNGLFFSPSSRYEYVAQVRLMKPELFKEKISDIKTYRSLTSNRMVQVHDASGNFRVRPAPTEDKKNPEYGEWQSAGADGKRFAEAVAR
jgi:hypothetical protein